MRLLKSDKAVLLKAVSPHGTQNAPIPTLWLLQKKNPLLENILYNYCISHLCKFVRELPPKCMFSMMEISPLFKNFISFLTGG